MPIAQDSDLAKLLGAMEAFRLLHQDDPEKTRETPMVHHDWTFHQEHSGLSQSRIKSLLPQLVAKGYAETRGSKRGVVPPVGLRAENGYAWISPRGQFELE